MSRPQITSLWWFELVPQPRLSPSHHHWECVPDVFHEEAFRGTPAEGMGRFGPRKPIWYSVDWCGNLIGEYGPCPHGAVGDTYTDGPFTREFTDVRVEERDGKWVWMIERTLVRYCGVLVADCDWDKSV